MVKRRVEPQVLIRGRACLNRNACAHLMDPNIWARIDRGDPFKDSLAGRLQSKIHWLGVSLLPREEVPQWYSGARSGDPVRSHSS